MIKVYAKAVAVSIVVLKTTFRKQESESRIQEPGGNPLKMLARIQQKHPSEYLKFNFSVFGREFFS